MSDLEKRLELIEQKIDASARTPSPYYDPSVQQNRNDEIDLRELWNVLWLGKWWIAGVTCLFAVVGVFYALSLPDLYKSEGVYSPAQRQGSGGGLVAQYGGLAALAGIDLGGGATNDIDQAVALVSSWPFLDHVIKKNNLGPYLLAAKGWDKKTRELIWDTEIFDPKSNGWLNSNSGESLAPTSYDAYDALRKLLSVNNDASTGMVSISVTHYSPEISADWVRLIISAINDHFQKNDIIEARRNVAYLEDKVNETGVMEMKSVFYGMIESQIKTLMLAEVSNEYILKEIIPPQIPERKSKPAKGLICIFFTMLGGFLSCMFILIKNR